MTYPEERKALDELFSLSYEELRRLAAGLLRGEGVARLTPTTLVNEAWLKLAPSPLIANTSPLHFRRIAGRAMRQVLVDIARKRLAQMQGSDFVHITFDEAQGLFSKSGNAREVLALDAALSELGRMSPRQLALVEARFFGGLSIEECVEELEVSEATLTREWRSARAWLAQQVRQSLHSRPPTAIAQDKALDAGRATGA
jgi:RNA polymerase sigma factor (TIGR02999 family)